MVILSDVLDDFINVLKQDAHFKEYKILKAYPYITKPTRLSKVILCISLGEVNGDSIGVGDNYIYGNYKINIDIFVPFSMGANSISKIFNNIIDTCSDNLPISISTSEITADGTTLCFTARCSLAFNNLLSLGA